MGLALIPSCSALSASNSSIDKSNITRNDKENSEYAIKVPQQRQHKVYQAICAIFQK